MDGTTSANEAQNCPRSAAPLISFVLPVYNAKRYLAKCLEAITQQSFADIEIIAIDGASDDGSDEILKAWQMREPRLAVHRASEVIGPGNARNLGAEKACGEYLWFVDADDTIASGCLTAIAQNLKVVMPDVLVVGYEIRHRGGRVSPGPVGELAKRITSTCFTMAEHPDVIDVSMASWNKIMRRNFYCAWGARFSPDWPHEDIGVSSLMLLEASKLSVLDLVCYRYRKDRPGSSMKSGEPRRHFKVFEAWEPVLADAQVRVKANEPPVTKEVYHAIFERAVGHSAILLDSGGWGIGLLGKDGYIARRDHREFFLRMKDLFRTYVPDGYVLPTGFLGIKFGLIQRGDYRRYAVLAPINRARNRIRLAYESLRGLFQLATR